MSEEFLCVRCARHMKTCCQTCEIYTTIGDLQRITDYTGRDDFYEFRAPANPAYIDQDDDPTWRDGVFQADGTRRVLKKQANGDCTFLGSAGCVLPLETRPLVCRIYPYDYTEAGIQDELSHGCPLELLKPEQTLIQALDMNVVDAERWRSMLYAEIHAEMNARGDAHSSPTSVSA
jgi:Fe-S-cluster containining protein